MSVQEIHLNEIDLSDKTYRYHYQKYDQNPLRQSIQTHGVLTPCLLEKSGAGFRIIHGFRRIHIARELRIDTIPAIFSAKPSLENLRHSLIDNRVQGEFNLYEEAKALECAANLGAKETEIIRDFLPLVGLHAHKNVYDDYRGFLRLPEQLIKFFVEKDIAISRTQIFQKLSESGQEIALDLLEQFSPGINVLDELMTNLFEISKRNEKPIREIYDNLEIEKILENAGQPHIALGQIRQQLQEYRYPFLSETNHEIEEIVSNFDLGNGVNIRWDKRLENRGVNITYHWKTVEDVKQSIAQLGESSNLTLFEAIFKKV